MAGAASAAALERIQQWLAAEGSEAERLVLVTNGAVAAGAGERPDLVGAAVRGLFRSACSEHPGRFALIDGDGSEASRRALPAALAATAEEPQLALREGRVLVPRLAPATAASEPARPLDPDSTVLITGGLSGIGALVARHLVEAGDARHLLLLSRRGGESEGAAELVAELERLGAAVAVTACDVSDRAQLERAIGSIDPENPLGAIVHSAGVVDDGTIESLDAERIAGVFAPKADAAWHLHELTEGHNIAQFVLFSSAAGLLGGAAQGNYAAANAFLDALAERRQAEGLPAVALAWGLWEQGSQAMVRELEEGEDERMVRQIRDRLGFAPISAELGLALFDEARSRFGQPLLAPVRFDRLALRAQVAAGNLPPLLRDLIRAGRRRERELGSLVDRLASLPEAEREKFVVDLVRSQAAAVLGYGSPAEVDSQRPFKEMGFDSLAAIELRKRIGGSTGLRLSATVVFDYPSVEELAGCLLREAGAEQPSDEAGADGVRAALAAEAEGEIAERVDAMEIEDLVERTLAGQAAEPGAGSEA